MKVRGGGGVQGLGQGVRGGGGVQGYRGQVKEWMHHFESNMQAAVLERINDIDQRIQSVSVRVSKVEDNAAHSGVNQRAECTISGVSQQNHTRMRKTSAELQASYSYSPIEVYCTNQLSAESHQGSV